MSFDVVDPGHRDKCVREWCCSDRAVNKTLRNCKVPILGKATTRVVLQCSDCQKTYAKKFICPYFLRRNKQGNEDR